MKDLKFLILEDNKYDRELITTAVSKFCANSSFHLMKDTVGFQEAFAEFQPDIVLSDYNLGIYNGLEVLEIVKDNSPETPFIIVTGTLEDEAAVTCLKQGAWDYVLKDKLYKLAPAIERSLEVQQEIISKKKAEDALKESEERLRLILDNSPFPVAVVDIEDENVFYWSKTARKMFGHTPKSTQEWYELAYPDPQYRKEVLERWKPVLEKARKSDKAINTGEYNIVCKDGSVKICELYAQFIPENLIVTLNDITQQYEANRKLQETSHEMQSILKGMLNAFVIFDSVFDEKGKFISYRFVYINDAYEEITGVNNAEVKGRTVHEVWPGTEQSWIEKYGHVATTGETLVFDNYHEPTNKLYHCRVFRPWSSNKRFCVIFDDVTEQRKAEKALMQKIEEQEIFNEAAVDRELMINDHRKEINDLLIELGRKPKYEIVE